MPNLWKPSTLTLVVQWTFTSRPRVRWAVCPGGKTCRANQERHRQSSTEGLCVVGATTSNQPASRTMRPNVPEHLPLKPDRIRQKKSSGQFKTGSQTQEACTDRRKQKTKGKSNLSQKNTRALERKLMPKNNNWLASWRSGFKKKKTSWKGNLTKVTIEFVTCRVRKKLKWSRQCEQGRWEGGQSVWRRWVNEQRNWMQNWN